MEPAGAASDVADSVVSGVSAKASPSLPGLSWEDVAGASAPSTAVAGSPSAPCLVVFVLLSPSDVVDEELAAVEVVEFPNVVDDDTPPPPAVVVDVVLDVVAVDVVLDLVVVVVVGGAVVVVTVVGVMVVVVGGGLFSLTTRVVRWPRLR